MDIRCVPSSKVGDGKPAKMAAGGNSQVTASSMATDTAASAAPARRPPTVVSAHTNSGSNGIAGAARPQPRRSADTPITTAAPPCSAVSTRTCQPCGARQHSAAARASAR